MIRKVTLRFTAFLGVVLLATAVTAQEAPVLKTEDERISYAVGVDLAKNLKRQGLEVETDALLQGMRDVLTGAKLLMTEDDLRANLNTFQVEVKQDRARTRPIVAEDNKRMGEAFLAENKTKEGVVTLPNGLQYKILKAGNGKQPTKADTVEVNYRGTLINGTEFNSSYRMGQPATLKVAEGIPGMTEALQLMPVGSKWQLFIPPELAYGEQGSGRDRRSGRKIGPYATLIFEVELLAIK
jgi:UDP-GlcNAc:undecaprenyl-phosphate/decaprenyl-phosphate GlcNAc-1-phosphate transferase